MTRNQTPAERAALVDQAWREMQTASTDAAFEAAKERYTRLVEEK